MHACRPLLNRATAGLYTPGSTFKVITTAAALESGKFNPASEFVDKGYCIEYGKKVFNFADQNGPEVFGLVTLTQALEHSINSVFCNIGKALGPAAILDQAQRFGFYRLPPLETPSDERAASGLYEKGNLFLPSDPNAVDPGRLAFGQERMLVTPLQMAMVAAGVAERRCRDDALRRRPDPEAGRIDPHADGARALLRGRPAPDGSRADRHDGAGRASGTGTAAQIPGVRVAGKTGTAETGTPDGENNAWFIGFAPADAPRVAVAVVLSGQSGTGGAGRGTDRESAHGSRPS